MARSKLTPLYEIWIGQGQSYSKRASMKLKTYSIACKLVKRLKSRGVDAFKAKIMVNRATLTKAKADHA